MPWIMEVKTRGVWLAVHPSSGKRYEYATEGEARDMLRICYPDQLREERLGGEQVARVREVPPQFCITFRARLKGALGLTEDFREVIEAADRNAAVLKLYETYEHISVDKIEEN